MTTRILVNHFSQTPHKFTSISVYSWNILEALVEWGRHEYALATNWDIDRLPPQICSFGIELVHRPRLGRVLSAVLKHTLEYTGLIRRLRCQAIFRARRASLLGGLRKIVVFASASRRGGFLGLMIFAEMLIFYPFAEPFLTKAAKWGIQRRRPSSIDTKAREV